MALFIEPGTATVEVAGMSIQIKTMTSSERVRFQRAMLKAHRIFEKYKPGERMKHEDTFDVQDAYFEALQVGLKTNPDTILSEHWDAVIAEVIKANEVDGDDAKN